MLESYANPKEWQISYGLTAPFISRALPEITITGDDSGAANDYHVTHLSVNCPVTLPAPVRSIKQ